MFERRLKVLLILPAICGLIILGRLFQLQVIHGDTYEDKADAALISPIQHLPPLRGRILDRFGRILVSDEPAHDVTVHFGVLAHESKYLESVATHIKRHEAAWHFASPQELEDEVERRIGIMWWVLENASGRPLAELRARRDSICSAVDDLREYIQEARSKKGLVQDLKTVRLREQDWFHPILRDVSPEARTRIELALSNFPFVRLEPSVRRVWRDEADPLCHVLGNMGQVTAKMVREDPWRDNEQRAYHAADDAGITGVELLAENILRGTRGFDERELDGTLIRHCEPLDGIDVQLTIDLDLQHQIAEILRQAVRESPPSTGASCVVIDVDTREIIALVSVPTYSQKTYRFEYAKLRDDVLGRPLMFRALQDEYPPGSTVKPVTLLAALALDEVGPEDTVYCDGSLVPGSKFWHCWTHWKDLPGHGTVSAETALQHSCNIYFYKLGEKINALRLTSFFEDFLYGPQRTTTRPAGTGLLAERNGLIPGPDFMKDRLKRDYTFADGRNYAIGQGEFQLTPLQVANMFATLATGTYRDPTVIVNDGRPRPIQQFKNLTPGEWEVARRGLDRCVNEQGGTAFSFVRMDELQICGKTGSAQCTPRVTKWTFHFKTRDNKTFTIQAPTEPRAREMLGLDESAKRIKREVAATWPPRESATSDYPTHAWFAGFAPYPHPKVAIAVLVEYGGAGGRTTGPVANQVFRALLDSPHGYLRSSGAQTIAGATP